MHPLLRAFRGSLPLLRAFPGAGASRSSSHPSFLHSLLQSGLDGRQAPASVGPTADPLPYVVTPSPPAPANPCSSHQNSPRTHAPGRQQQQATLPSPAQRSWRFSALGRAFVTSFAASLTTAHAADDDDEDYVPPAGFELDTAETVFQDTDYHGDDQPLADRDDGEEDEEEIELSFAESWGDRNWRDETIAFLSSQGGPALISEATAVAGARLNVGSAGDGHTPEIAAFVRTTRLDMSASRSLRFGDPQVLPLGLGLVSVCTSGSELAHLLIMELRVARGQSFTRG